MIRTLFLSTMLLTMQSFSQEPSLAKTSIDSEPVISVHISSKDSHVRQGQDVLLQVEIWNEGKQDLFISKEIDDVASNTLATLQVRVYKGTEPVGPFLQVVADCFCSERSSYPPLSLELPKYWIALPPHHFYGKQVVIHADQLAGLKAGRYRIQGTYQSLGFLAQNLNNPLAHYAQELKELPFQSWVGEVHTNPTWIELISTSGSRNHR
jgi:hypothetical protein